MPALAPRGLLGNEYDLAALPQTNHSSHVPLKPSAAQYSYGLNGVNVDLDNRSSQVLYVGIGIIFMAITLFRLLQRGNAHLRQLTTYGSNDKQLFWTRDQSTIWSWLKRNVVYAPIRKIRHNREIQLSKAINLGTLPGRLHLALLLTLALAQLAFMTLLNYNQSQIATLAELRGRSGHLAVMNMIALFIMAGRNNPFIRILRVSFDTFNLFHRWIGRIIILESLIHIIAWAAVKVSTSSWTAMTSSVVNVPFLGWGFVSTVALILIMLHSPSPIRHAFYETFLVLHQFLAFVATLGIFYHAKLGALPQYWFIVAVILIWTYDRVCRLGRILYNNFSFKKGLSKVVVEALPGEACRVTFHTPRPFTPAAGSHVYVYLPNLAWWQSHPFSVAWTNTTANIQINEDDLEKGAIIPSTATSVSLIISARTGMTRSLYAKACRTKSKQLVVRGFIEGPYGSLESLHSYGTVLLFAGGVGITHHLPHIRDLVLGHGNKTTSTQKIILTWVIRNEDALEWIRPWMDEILCMPNRREVLQINVYITKSNRSSLSSGSTRVQILPGRPRVHQIVQHEFSERTGAMCIGVCGPGAFADDVRCAAREVVQDGKVDFFEEAFTW